MSELNFTPIEQKWLNFWEKNDSYKTDNTNNKKKFYCLDMFPYPSGAGLHVGHPRGYIATDIVSRFKRMQGFNVLHPMGFDSFGLPAEQYAIETGQAPQTTTDQNIKTFKSQLRKLGLSYDTKREVRTSDPKYYKWTQWIFLKLFDHWYDTSLKTARPIADLIQHLDAYGSKGLNAFHEDEPGEISVSDWAAFSTLEKQAYIMSFRLAYRGEAYVNWCPNLGTVLANDEVQNGLSERGGHPVEKKKMKQWMLRITAYADRLLNNLEQLDWTPALKEMQSNWIGRSEGVKLTFKVENTDDSIVVFTTKIETLFGVTFIALAPEHQALQTICPDSHRAAVSDYIASVTKRSARERAAQSANFDGVYIGLCASHPVTGESIPIWVADYVIAEYGTGAIMGVPSCDERDFQFASTFGIPIKEISLDVNNDQPYDSDRSNNLSVHDSTAKSLNELSKLGYASRVVKYKLRDAIFGRQRYWGEPIPIYYDDNGISIPVPAEALPVELPKIDNYLPTSDGEPPLARAIDWTYEGNQIEVTTMPGWAGSSWYFLRYMDPENSNEFASRSDTDYWNQVDLYMGGSEHATGHLLYSRFWNMFLFDIDAIGFEEPFKRIVCQGMILGKSAKIYRDIKSNRIVSADLKSQFDTQPLYVDISFVDEKDNSVDLSRLQDWRKDYHNSEFVLSNGRLISERLIEKMSKSKYNVVVPDDVINYFGADTFRLHEMFLGPIDQSAPWSIQSIEGCSKFLSRVWRLFYNGEGTTQIDNDDPTDDQLKAINDCIKNVTEMTSNLSFNTAIASLMTCVNSLTKLKTRNAEILEKLVLLLHPYAPFVSSELWHVTLNKTESILDHEFPVVNETYLKISECIYSISVNGKLRTSIAMAIDEMQEKAVEIALKDKIVKRWVEKDRIIKVIFVKNKIINFVVK